MRYTVSKNINKNRFAILKNKFQIDFDKKYSAKELQSIFKNIDIDKIIILKEHHNTDKFKCGECYAEQELVAFFGAGFKSYLIRFCNNFIKFQDAFIQVKEEIKEEVVEEQPEIITQAEETEEELFQEEGKNKRGKSKKS